MHCACIHLRTYYRWYELRKGAESFYNISSPEKLCFRGGRKWYKPMNLENAVFPALPNYIPDDSPDVLNPTAESRYITEDYDMTVGGHDSALRAQAE